MPSSADAANERTPFIQREAAAVTSWFEDFKAFISKGNVVDMAIGIIIGGAFGAIVSSAVDDIFSPFISLFTGGSQLQNAFFMLRGPNKDLCREKNNPCVYFPTPADANAVGAITINYGRFIQLTINFLTVALILFSLVRFFTKLQERFKKDQEKKELLKDDAPKASPDRACPYCCQKVPAAASKCMFCTSALQPQPDVEVQAL
ncbi:hypothetical protein HDU96_003230 [Phlyctochytrium bullatum]|nr:hypothetical protein HDU96_003230 [Phlyctochytrium bullatum]